MVAAVAAATGLIFNKHRKKQKKNYVVFVVFLALHLLCSQQYLAKCFYGFFLSLQLAIKIVIEIDIAIEIKIENGAEQLFAGLVVAEQQAICCGGLK